MSDIKTIGFIGIGNMGRPMATNLARGGYQVVAYDADGKWEIRTPKGKPGDYMTMTALMPQIVAISNCPILFNACNNYKLKPLTLEILK